MMKTTPIALLLLAALTLAGCANRYAAAPVGDKILWATQEQRPEWVVGTPVADKEYTYFVGISHHHGTERLARENAIVNAKGQVVSYAAAVTRKEGLAEATAEGEESDKLSADIRVRDFESTEALGVVSRGDAAQWYAEQWSQGDDRFWKVFVLLRVPNDSLQALMPNPREAEERKASGYGKEGRSGRTPASI